MNPQAMRWEAPVMPHDTSNLESCVQPDASFSTPASVTAWLVKLSLASCVQPDASSSIPASVTEVQRQRSSEVSRGHPVARLPIPTSVTSGQLLRLSLESRGQPRASIAIPASVTALQLASLSLESCEHHASFANPIDVILGTCDSERFVRSSEESCEHPHARFSRNTSSRLQPSRTSSESCGQPAGNLSIPRRTGQPLYMCGCQ